MVSKAEEEEEFLKEIGGSLYFAFRRKRNKVKRRLEELIILLENFKSLLIIQ